MNWYGSLAMRWSTFYQEWDPELKMMVARSADTMARETKTAVFRRGLLQRKSRYRTIYNQHGRPIAQVHCHDSGNTEHEWTNHQDAVTRPDPIVAELNVGSRPSFGLPGGFQISRRPKKRVWS